MKLLKSHRGYYLSFGILMFLCMTLLLKSSTEPGVRFIVLLLSAFLYAFWGIVHHIIHHDVTLKIVLEYILIGSLGVILVLFIGS